MKYTFIQFRRNDDAVETTGGETIPTTEGVTGALNATAEALGTEGSLLDIEHPIHEELPAPVMEQELVEETA